MLGPDGRPVPGAKLYQTDSRGPLPFGVPVVRVCDDRAGRPLPVHGPQREMERILESVAAAAPNLGVGWVVIPAGGKTDDLTVQLVNDDAPITGQIVNLQGKPVQGATLRVTQINAAPGEDLGPWLEAVKARSTSGSRVGINGSRICISRAPSRRLSRSQATPRAASGSPASAAIAWSRHNSTGQPSSASTCTSSRGRASRFLYAPSNREAVHHHLLWVQLPARGRTHQADHRRGARQGHEEADRGFHNPQPQFRASPNEFEMIDIVRTTTDAEGRYRLIGMPSDKRYRIVAVPPTDQPYVSSTRVLPDTPGLDAVTLDFELKRGVWITGKVTDKVTGKPLRANVEYFTFESNPNLSDYDGFSMSVMWHFIETKDDGTYRVAGMPGPGLVAVFTRSTT